MLSMIKNIIMNGSATEKKACAKNFMETACAPLIRLDEKKCAACRDKKCVKLCPTGAIYVSNEKGATVKTDHLKCIECRMCEDNCQSGAVSFADFGIGTAEFKAMSDKLEKEIKGVFSRSLHIRQLDVGSCNGCDHEMISVCNPVFDISRFGIDFVASPRHADCLLVTGPVSWNLKESLIRTIEATPDPKIVVAMGACASSGAPFGKSYASFGGVDKVSPVDVFVPGCPPHPYAIIEGLLRAVRMIGKK